MKFGIYEQLIVDSVSPRNAEKWATQADGDPQITPEQRQYLHELCKYQCAEINKKRRQENGRNNKKRKRR